eukprot:2177052-Pyramimonas_sp.AAC.1
MTATVTVTVIVNVTATATAAATVTAAANVSLPVTATATATATVTAAATLPMTVTATVTATAAAAATVTATATAAGSKQSEGGGGAEVFRGGKRKGPRGHRLMLRGASGAAGHVWHLQGGAPPDPAWLPLNPNKTLKHLQGGLRLVISPPLGALERPSLALECPCRRNARRCLKRQGDALGRQKAPAAIG